MKKATKEKLKPEQGMTRDEAVTLASIDGDHLEDIGRNGQTLAPFILLLRWLAYVGTKDDAETIYILTEEEYATNFDGVDEAIMEDLGNAPVSTLAARPLLSVVWGRDADRGRPPGRRGHHRLSAPQDGARGPFTPAGRAGLPPMQQPPRRAAGRERGLPDSERRVAVKTF